jgi:hypothetical protein
MIDEKARRIYYQDIVYKVCNLLDKHFKLKPGQGIVCGTVENPSTKVQDKISDIINGLSQTQSDDLLIKEIYKVIKWPTDDKEAPYRHYGEKEQFRRIKEAVLNWEKSAALDREGEKG